MQLSARRRPGPRVRPLSFFLFSLLEAVASRVAYRGLSIDSKLPIVSYATAFDHFAMACQLLLLSIILGRDSSDLPRGARSGAFSEGRSEVAKWFGGCWSWDQVN